MKKIAILGGSHFIGVHLFLSLLQQGHELTLYNRNITKSPVPYPEGLEIIKGEVVNFEFTLRIETKNVYDKQLTLDYLQ